MKQKLYCYVDESGQDTKGNVFIVSVVVTSRERDELLKLCEEIEQKSGKHKDKWGRSKSKRRLDYIKRVFSNKNFKERLRYSIYRNQTNYDLATITSIAKAVHFKEPTRYATLVYVDGLRKNKRQEYGSELRKLGIPIRKVQGINKDEGNALIRLADAVAGFVRDIADGNKGETQKIFKKAKETGGLIEV